MHLEEFSTPILVNNVFHDDYAVPDPLLEIVGLSSEMVKKHRKNF